MTPFKVIKIAALSVAIALPSMPVMAASTVAPTSFLDLKAEAGDGMIITVKKGRSGTGLRGRDRGRDDNGGRGRGRGRGKDDGAGHVRHGGNDDVPGKEHGPEHEVEHEAEHEVEHGVEHESGSGRKRPRVPGGSGCDDPRDLLEHAAC